MIDGGKFDIGECCDSESQFRSLCNTNSWKGFLRVNADVDGASKANEWKKKIEGNPNFLFFWVETKWLMCINLKTVCVKRLQEIIYGPIFLHLISYQQIWSFLFVFTCLGLSMKWRSLIVEYLTAILSNIL